MQQYVLHLCRYFAKKEYCPFDSNTVQRKVLSLESTGAKMHVLYLVLNHASREQQH